MPLVLVRIYVGQGTGREPEYAGREPAGPEPGYGAGRAGKRSGRDKSGRQRLYRVLHHLVGIPHHLLHVLGVIRGCHHHLMGHRNRG